MTALSGIRRRLQKLGPYQSLILILLPLLLVEPLKLVALVIAGKGHWLAGTGMIIGAYATSLLCVERLFRALKPKLLMMKWFAKGWIWFSAFRNKTIAWGLRAPAVDTETARLFRSGCFSLISSHANPNGLLDFVRLFRRVVTWEDDPKNSFGGPYWITQRKTTL